MIEDSPRAEFDGVEVIEHTGLVLRCRVGKKIVGVPPALTLTGTTIANKGDYGRLVVSRGLALNLGLLTERQGGALR
jgi:hypothetical protein